MNIITSEYYIFLSIQGGIGISFAMFCGVKNLFRPYEIREGERALKNRRITTQRYITVFLIKSSVLDYQEHTRVEFRFHVSKNVIQLKLSQPFAG